ncbi:hypothetical protein Poly51_26140 [Rubripirellula tenax]|uniref:Uncharacterized protein n=1 Tax=Rubripirellula tenax TaxID=2528015 RepID=A0A5C6F8K6_9BACT|nr:hypothetical protein [Rubripirellula tenax]TWU56697.1 hypothetical protein Poly51_26140 [Rubripirellula tenax]
MNDRQSDEVAVDPATGLAAESVRIGSPFAVDPLPQTVAIEPLLDVGPMRYTAMGAVAASMMVVGFASAALWWFPAGGALVAALGSVLAISGLFSNYRTASLVLLFVHVGLFVANYSQVLR